MDAAFDIAKNIVNLRYKDIPPEIVDLTKKSVLDTLGVIAGASTMGQGCQEIESASISDAPLVDVGTTLERLSVLTLRPLSDKGFLSVHAGPYAIARFFSSNSSLVISPLA